MKARFHRQVQSDLNTILKHYYKASEGLGDDFYEEFMRCVRQAVSNPRFYHFDESNLRRCNLERFPHHFLYDIKEGIVRVWVLRHDHRRSSFGMKRF